MQKLKEDQVQLDALLLEMRDTLVRVHDLTRTKGIVLPPTIAFNCGVLLQALIHDDPKSKKKTESD